jgi:2-dehydropantoate 2-reductase
MDQSSKIAVVGAGPVGGILAAHLIRAGHEVTVIDIYKGHVDKMLADGLAVEGVHELTAPISRAHLTVEEAVAAGVKCDCVFVCTKTQINRAIVGALPGLLSESGVGISFQNGLDPERSLLDVLGPDRTLRGVVNYAGNLLEPGRIRMHFFTGPNHLGAAAPGNARAGAAAQALAEILTAADLRTDYAERVAGHVWAKVIRNAGLMPVSALTGMNMRQVMESTAGLALVKSLLAEAIAVAARAGFDLGERFFEDSLDYYRKAGPHMPSMWADVQARRTTEIEFLNLGIALAGERVGVPAPCNRALADLVRCIDELALVEESK